jgi:Transposase IS200 like
MMACRQPLAPRWVAYGITPSIGGSRRDAVFRKPGDYDAFVEAMIGARARLPVDLLGYCLMPNHFHLVVRPHHDGAPGRWMQRLLTTHAQRYHRHYGTTGTSGRGDSTPFRFGMTTVSFRCSAMSSAMRCEPSTCRGPRTGSGRACRVEGAAPRCYGGAKSLSAMRGGWSASTSRSRRATFNGCGTRCRGADRMAKTPGLGRRRSGWAWIRACVPRDDRVRRTSKSPMSPVSPVATLQLAKVEHLLKEAAACGYGVLFE